MILIDYNNLFIAASMNAGFMKDGMDVDACRHIFLNVIRAGEEASSHQVWGPRHLLRLPTVVAQGHLPQLQG